MVLNNNYFWFDYQVVYKYPLIRYLVIITLGHVDWRLKRRIKQCIPSKYLQLGRANDMYKILLFG